MVDVTRTASTRIQRSIINCISVKRTCGNQPRSSAEPDGVPTRYGPRAIRAVPADREPAWVYPGDERSFTSTTGLALVNALGGPLGSSRTISSFTTELYQMAGRVSHLSALLRMP